MDLGRITPNSLSPLQSALRLPTLPPPSGNAATRRGGSDPALKTVLERTRAYKVHIEQHRLTEVDMKLTVGGGGGAKVDATAVAQAQTDPALSELHGALEGFDSLTEDQRNMVLAAGSFLKTRDQEGYTALVDFIGEAKKHAADNPGGAFTLAFSFHSQDSLVVDYVEEVRERVTVALPPPGAEQTPPPERAEAVQVSRRTVMSLSVQHQKILISLGEILADIQAGLKPELLPETVKPADASSELLHALLETIADPKEALSPKKHNGDEKTEKHEKEDEDEGRKTEKVRPLAQPPAYGATKAHKGGSEPGLTVGYA